MKHKVLVVDDEPDVVAYLKTLLRSNGYTPYAAMNVDDGFRLAFQEQPHLICLDVMMPEETGISLYIRLQKNPKLKDIPVILISGIVQDGDVDLNKILEKHGVLKPDHFLDKPIQVETFLETISNILSVSENN